MPARTTTIRALMWAILAVAVLMGGMIAAETAAPADFPVVFRILLFEGIVGLVLWVLILRAVPRDDR